MTAPGERSSVDGGTDPCGTVETANDVREDATPYTLDTEFHACLQTKDDVDFYEYTVPGTPSQGGVVVVKITEVGAAGGITAAAQAVADNGEIESNYGGRGTSVFLWFNAKAGASFRLKVSPFLDTAEPVPYTLKMNFVGVPDSHEPNDLLKTAAPLTVGVPAQGYLFAGYENSTGVPDDQFADWYKVTLAAGKAKIALTNLASDVNGLWELYDADGVSVTSKYEGDRGASIVATTDALATGQYYVRAIPFTRPTVAGPGSTAPSYTREPYTLTVTVAP